jgi:hypothetical protein
MFDLELTIRALLIIAIFTYLIKDTIIYRFAERIFVGLAFAVVAVTGVSVIFNTSLIPATEGNFIGIPGLILGILMFARLSKGLTYVGRWPLALLMGVGSGISLGGIVQTTVTRQMRAIAGTTFTGSPLEVLGSILAVVFALCSILYFIFTYKTGSGILEYPAKLGRLALMLTFGAAYGMTVAGRYALLASNILFLVREWLMGLLGMA